MTRKPVYGETARRLKSTMDRGNRFTSACDTVEVGQAGAATEIAITVEQVCQDVLTILSQKITYTRTDNVNRRSNIWTLTFPDMHLTLTSQPWTYKEGLFGSRSRVDINANDGDKKKEWLDGMAEGVIRILRAVPEQAFFRENPTSDEVDCALEQLSQRESGIDACRTELAAVRRLSKYALGN